MGRGTQVEWVKGLDLKGPSLEVRIEGKEKEAGNRGERSDG